MPASILLKEKQAKILVLLKDEKQAWYISNIAKACNTTYVHTCNFIKTCEAMGLTKNEKHGKIKEIRLTEKGHQVADMLSGIYGILNQAQNMQIKQVDAQPKIVVLPPPEKK